MTAAPVLEAKGLYKKYRSRHVLQDISLIAAPAEIVGLLGSNGAGKTTSFYILAGLATPSAGTVSFGDEDITYLPINQRAKRGIGFLPQENSAFIALSVLDNLRAVLEIQGKKGNVGLKIARQMLDDLHIAHLASQQTGELSGGELRRLEIARALVLQPKLLLLDEPFAGIDPITVTDLQRVMRQLRDRGIGLVISDHNVRETLSICDRAYILHAGKLLCQGKPEELAANELVQNHYLGKDFRF